ncbi:MAG: alpha/beta hydrolase [Pseudomonadota bacterium]
MSVALLGLLVLLLPFAIEAFRRPVEARRDGTERLVALPDGATHIVIEGPEDGPVIVLIHGLLTPSFLFSGVAPLLCQAGYRVVRYDLYGRGLSDRPKQRQDMDLFLRQLDGVLANTGAGRDLILLGYSMGGVIAAGAAARDPDAVRAVLLVAPAGLGTIKVPPVFLAPLLGDWLVRLVGGVALRKRMAEGPQVPSAIPDIARREAEETRVRGFLPAVLSAMRHSLNRDMGEEYRRLAAAGTPILAIWAGDDGTIPQTSPGRLAELNARARHHQIDGAGHGVIHTRPGEVAAEILKFLKSA